MQLRLKQWRIAGEHRVIGDRDARIGNGSLARVHQSALELIAQNDAARPTGAGRINHVNIIIGNGDVRNLGIHRRGRAIVLWRFTECDALLLPRE